MCKYRHTLQALGVTAARAPLHLHTRRPQQEMCIATVQHGARDLDDLGPDLTDGLLSWLSICRQEIHREAHELQEKHSTNSICAGACSCKTLLRYLKVL